VRFESVDEIKVSRSRLLSASIHVGLRRASEHQQPYHTVVKAGHDQGTMTALVHLHSHSTRRIGASAPGAGKFLGVARIFSGGCTFSPRKS